MKTKNDLTALQILQMDSQPYLTNFLTDPVFDCVCRPGGNYRGVFALGLVQGEWKMYVKGPLDREECNLYNINVTASDGLFVSQATVEVTVVDTNDNSPICDKVRNKVVYCFVLFFYVTDLA